MPKKPKIKKRRLSVQVGIDKKQVYKFPVVGIGTSSGGTEALKEFLNELPCNTGMAFVIVQHLYPQSESLAENIFSKHTSMPTVTIKTGMKIEPNHVYLSPPWLKLSLRQGTFFLESETDPQKAHRLIDYFFETLAAECKFLGIGVIFSGIGNDGMKGLRAIKNEGGVTLAQDPSSALHGEMPSSAIDAGVVDIILPITKIAKELVRISKNDYFSVSAPVWGKYLGTRKSESEIWKKIFALLRKTTRVDFSEYKESTLRRRIIRRMVLNRFDSFEEYISFLQAHPSEIEALFSELLINVTSFFRDPKAFKALEHHAFPTLLKDRAPGSTLRIWVPGCATGEEVYSLAISLIEYLGQKATSYPIQIFASDISQKSIERARLGVYSKNEVEGIPKRLLEVYFTKSEGQGEYKIKKFVRDLCLFSNHDVTADPPFAGIDLISCRNLLIYFSRSLQQRVVPIFHYALKPSGILWLGSSEAIAVSNNLFTILDKIYKIHQKKEVAVPIRTLFAVPKQIFSGYDLGDTGPTNNFEKFDLGRETDRILSARYGPCGVLVNNDLDILHIHGKVAPFVGLPTGQASFQLTKMIRVELLPHLRKLMEEVKDSKTSVRKENLSLVLGDEIIEFSMEILPLKEEANQFDRKYLILFNQVSSQAGRLKRREEPVKQIEKDWVQQERLKYEQQLAVLEQELAASREYAQSLIEDRMNSQEAFSSAHEELQSMNEELQSTNEELETAKEELQSTNEELNTVNEELQNRNNELTLLTNDLINFLSSFELAMVMVDESQRIRRFTPRAEKLLNLIQGDVGRPLKNIKTNLDISNLEDRISEVLRSLVPVELEVRDLDGIWYQLQIRPYRTTENKIDGAVLSFVGINNIKIAYQDLKRSEEKFRILFDSAYDAIVKFDEKGMIRLVNQQTEKRFGYFRNELIGQPIEMLIPEGLGKKVFQEKKGETLPAVGQKGTGLEFYGRRKNGSIFPIEVGLSPIKLASGFCFIAIIRDITERKKSDEDRQKLLLCEKEAKEEAESANRAKDIFLATLSHELRTPLTTILTWSQLIDSGRVDQSKIKRGMQMIQESALVQEQLINDLLDVSRILMGKLQLEFVNTDLVKILKNSIECVRPAAEKKSLRIKAEFQSEIEFVFADSRRLSQIIWNLLNNSIKFTPNGGEIFVKLSVVNEGAGRKAKIEIQDTGRGIESKFIPHLFERFSQSEKSGFTQGGLGLGLAVVKSLLDLHRGTITGESDGPGKGAKFTVILPSCNPSENEILVKKAIAASESFNKTTNPDLSGLRILFIDDDEKTRETMSLALSSYGAEIFLASTGSEGFSAFRKFKPAALVTDISMPGVDGYNLIKKIRALKKEEGSQTPAIALTAFAGYEDSRHALLAGFQVHLSKPVDIVRLATTIEILVKRSKS